MQKKKNIFLISFVSSLNLMSCAGVNASEKHNSEPKSSSAKSTNEIEKNNIKDVNSFMSTVKKHPVASALTSASVLSIIGGGSYFKFFRNGDSGGGGGSNSKAKATIDAINKLTGHNTIEGFLSALGGLGDNTVRVVVDWNPELKYSKWCSYVNSTKENFAGARLTIVNIITDALNNDLNKNEYEDGSKYLNHLPQFKNFGWLRQFRNVKVGDRKYMIWFGMDKNDEDLLIKIDLSLGMDWS